MADVNKDRREMKKLIRRQMEFYFSDANLNRDNFMRKAITASHDGFIDITEFLKFNKIRKITGEPLFVARALKKSKELQVSEDQSSVKRIIPMKDIENVDDRTVYVEFLPPNATHDWLTEVFSICGKVSYVSLPHYPSSGDIKQFAFIEYTSPDEAKIACEKLNNPPEDAPEKIGKFPAWNKTLYTRTKQVQALVPEQETVDETANPRKRRLDNEDNSEDNVKKKRQDSESSEDSDSETETCDATIDESDLPRLRVIPKSEWLKLKGEYISLQKSNMAKLKKTLNKVKKDTNCPEKQKPNTQVMEKGDESQPKAKARGPEFVPNVIVTIEAAGPLTKQIITDEFGAKCNIAYVEVPEGSNLAFVRCKDAFSAEMIVNSGKEGHTSTLLHGEDEIKYWEKLASDRNEKLNNKQQRKKKTKQQQNKKTYFD